MHTTTQTRETGLVYKRGADGLRDDKGIYAWKGRKYPSVTTVLGQFSDFMFVHRAKVSALVTELAGKVETGEVHERWQQEPDPFHPEYDRWVRRSASPLECLCDGDYIANEGLRYVKACADRGSALHDLLADFAQGLRLDLLDLPEYLAQNILTHKRSCQAEDVLPYARSLVRWLDKYQPVIWYSEMPVFCDEHEYAGTMDLVMLLGDNLYLVDLKSNDSFKRSWAAQVSAYAHAGFGVVDRDHGIEVDVPKLDGKALPCAVLMVTPERAGMRPFDPVPYFNKLFLPALAAWRANNSMALPKDQAIWEDYR